MYVATQLPFVPFFYELLSSSTTPKWVVSFIRLLFFFPRLSSRFNCKSTRFVVVVDFYLNWFEKFCWRQSLYDPCDPKCVFMKCQKNHDEYKHWTIGKILGMTKLRHTRYHISFNRRKKKHNVRHSRQMLRITLDRSGQIESGSRTNRFVYQNTRAKLQRDNNILAEHNPANVSFFGCRDLLLLLISHPKSDLKRNEREKCVWETERVQVPRV